MKINLTQYRDPQDGTFLPDLDGIPLFYITQEGRDVCPHCANYAEEGGDECLAAYVSYADDLRCDICNRRIPT